jgi:Helix-turn-helix domain
MTTHAIAPHTRIDNSIIDDLASQIGIYGLGIYVAIKRHLNQKTGDCFPSYKTIAKKLHIDRGTVIRYVKKLKAFNLLDPQLRFKEDGSPTSNQYNFQGAENSVPSNDTDKEVHIVQGGSTEPLPVVAQDNHPGCTKLPEQSPTPNKKQRSITDVDLMPTEKQKTCPHPPAFIVILPDNITICNHCYGLLDENLKLREEETPPVEIVAA